MTPGTGGFITLEGGEGSGKSTQARRLVERIRAAGHEALGTREPGGSPRAERIRDALLSGVVAPLGPVAEAMMFAAARIDHLDATIRPALARGSFVVCDRFVDSTRVYQGAVDGVDAGLLAGLERLVVGETMPDLTVLLDLDVATGLARARARRGAAAPDRFEREAETYHEGLRRAFLDNAGREPGRCLVVDAGRSLDDVAETLWLIVGRRFPALGRGAAGGAP
ncbi:dTMP kinase [Lichenibacterium ramalinae]|uniref:Thymidylate kinase n=1 Tax=Lichenibacterium ramalinae TaxID=2316527 RepID=A0A4Q2RGV6_9HYPH|nr:dTMP kinase [Lichenibacterium ramalinae]RYB05074.1 dTMP kinase [Lichenibacterium ramalinae]